MQQAAPEGTTRRTDARPLRPGARPLEERPGQRSSAKDCPVETLVRLAVAAEAEGDLRLAIRICRELLGYSHPRPRPVEVEPEARIRLEAALSQARRSEPDDTTVGPLPDPWLRKMTGPAAGAQDRSGPTSERPRRPLPQRERLPGSSRRWGSARWKR